MSEPSSHPPPLQAESGLPHPPPRVPDHELLRRIGQGSYGEVWLARNVMGQWRAVKVVALPPSVGDERLYEREFDGVRRYEPVSRSHESLMQVLHVGRHQSGDCFYYVMELADDAGTGPQPDAPPARGNPAEPPPEGPLAESTYAPRTLRSELKRRGRLPPTECVRIGTALATALEHLHQYKLVHRDIKPSNVIFVGGRPKLADIGLVTDFDATRSFVGTQGYVPREGPGEAAADIFALGKVLYEMATGRDRCDFPSLPSMAGLDEREQRQLRELNAVILKACANDPRDRHRDAAELRDELLRLQLGESIEHQRALELALARIRRVAPWLGAAVALAGAAAVFWGASQRAAEQARRRELLLREAQHVRLRDRTNGWSAYAWQNAVTAAGLRPDAEAQAGASMALAGHDAEDVQWHRDCAAGSAAFAPDGRAVTGGWQQGGRSWPASLFDTNGVRTPLPVARAGPVCWTAAGQPIQFAEAVDGGACEQIDLMSGRILGRYPFAPGERVPVIAGPVLAVLGDGNLAAAALTRQTPASPGERVIGWDTRTGRALGEAASQATALAFTPDGTMLIAGTDMGEIELRTLPGLALRAALAPASGRSRVNCLTVTADRLVPYESGSPTNRWLLAAGHQGGQILIRELPSGRVRSFCRGAHYDAVSVVFHPDGQTLAAGGHSDTRLWDVAGGQLLLRLTGGSTDDHQAIAFDPDGNRLLWGTADPSFAVAPTTALCQLSPHRGIRLLRGLPTRVRRVWIAPDSRRVAALSDDWHLAIWELASGRLAWVFEAPRGVYADNAGGAFDPTGARFAFATRVEARLYDLASGATLRTWPLEEGLSDEVQFGADSRLWLARRERIAGAPKPNWWHLYELPAAGPPTLRLAQTNVDWPVTEVRLAANVRRLIVWNRGERGRPKTIRCLDTEDGRELWAASTAPIQDAQPRVFLEATGRWLLHSTNDTGGMRVIDLSSSRAVASLPPEAHALSPDGGWFTQPLGQGFRVVDLAGRDSELVVSTDWEVSAPQTFSPDGRFLVWGTSEGWVAVAELPEIRRRLEPVLLSQRCCARER
jgi:hypothetical protein